MTPNGTALVVDDSAVNRLVLVRRLETLGLDVIQAENGREALEVLAAEPGRVDVVLLDVIMPELDGYETLAAMKGTESTRLVGPGGHAARGLGVRGEVRLDLAVALRHQLTIDERMQVGVRDRSGVVRHFTTFRCAGPGRPSCISARRRSRPRDRRDITVPTGMPSASATSA